MSSDAAAVLGFVALFGLIFMRVPVGMAMGLVGMTGYGAIVGAGPALKMVGQTSMRTVTDYTFGVIPMFLLMGAFVSASGMSRELFRAANSSSATGGAASASPRSPPAPALPLSAVRRSRPAGFPAPDPPLLLRSRRRRRLPSSSSGAPSPSPPATSSRALLSSPLPRSPPASPSSPPSFRRAWMEAPDGFPRFPGGLEAAARSPPPPPSSPLSPAASLFLLRRRLRLWEDSGGSPASWRRRRRRGRTAD